MTFDDYGAARRFMLSELCYLAAESIHESIGHDALTAATALHQNEASAAYKEWRVGEYVYYISRVVDALGG